MYSSPRIALATTALAGLAALTGCSSSVDTSPASADSAARQEVAPDGVAHEYAVMAEEIGAEGGEVTDGPWRIGYIVEPAEPWFETMNGEQVKREPAPGETHHIEVLPFEESSGRLVPDTPVRLEVVAADGSVVDARPLAFLHGEFFHYANNFSVPEAGDYTLRVTIDPPTFLRHGETAGELTLTEGTTVEFPGVRLDS